MTDKLSDVLMQATTGGPRPPMQKAIRGDIEWSELDKKDWIEPVRYTNGKVCLKIQANGIDYPMYVSVDSDGYFIAWEQPSDEPRDMRRSWLERWIDDAEVTAVLREDTPFQKQ